MHQQNTDCDDSNPPVNPIISESIVSENCSDNIDDDCNGNADLSDNNCLGVSSNLPDTRQDKCYNNSAEITCPSVGEDFFGQDAHYTTNSMSFKDNGDGTITDNVTGLVWAKCTAGESILECGGSVSTKKWQEAIDYCLNNNAGLPGTGWQLPNLFELLTIVDYGKNNPSINTIFSPGKHKAIHTGVLQLMGMIILKHGKYPLAQVIHLREVNPAAVIG